MIVFCYFLLLFLLSISSFYTDGVSSTKTCENNPSSHDYDSDNQSCKTTSTSTTTYFEPIGYLPVDLIHNNNNNKTSNETSKHYLFLQELFDNRIQQLFSSKSYTKKKEVLSQPNNQSYRIAIFNSFDFHYEMFGYIIYYAMYYNYHLTVYTNLHDKYEWIEFYNEYFHNNYTNNTKLSQLRNQPIIWKNFSFYEQERHQYDVTILPTDDDDKFKDIWATSQTIAIDHLPLHRKVAVTNHITVRPMRYTKDINAPITKETDRKKIKLWPLPWALPCFPILSWQEKEYILRHEVDPGIINVAIVGGYQYFYHKINRLRAADPTTSRIVLYLFSRGDDRVFRDKDKFGSHLTVHMYHSVKTEFLHSVLRKCHYIFTDNSPPGDFQEQGMGMSGSVPLSFAYLATLILSRYNNGYYRFKNAFEFDVNAHESVRIVLNATKVLSKLQVLSKERSKLVSMFHRYMDNFLLSTSM